MHRIFIDTEFTQFRDGQLLSLGMVADNGGECYVEVTEPERQVRASDFCRHTVIPQFGLVPDAAMPDDRSAGMRAADWLDAFGGPLVVSYDYKLDWFFLESILRAARRWDRLAPTLRADDIAGIAPPGSPAEAAQNRVFESSHPMKRHHALVDARALRAAWQAHSASAQPLLRHPS